MEDILCLVGLVHWLTFGPRVPLRGTPKRDPAGVVHGVSSAAACKETKEDILCLVSIPRLIVYNVLPVQHAKSGGSHT